MFVAFSCAKKLRKVFEAFFPFFVRISDFLAFLVQKTFKKFQKNSCRLFDIFVAFCDNFHMLKLVKK
jgi:hypothetical protein